MIVYTLTRYDEDGCVVIGVYRTQALAKRTAGHVKRWTKRDDTISNCQCRTSVDSLYVIAKRPVVMS